MKPLNEIAARRKEEMKRLSSEWAKKAKPVLSRILFENPSAIIGLSYSVSSNLPTAGGSFYNPDSFQRKIRKEGDKYFIDTFVHDDTLYKIDEQGYNLKEVSEVVSSELLERAAETYGWTKTNRTFGNISISGRRYLLNKIKREIGVDLKKEVKKQGLEGKLPIVIAISGLVLSIFFLSSNITGNVIGSQSASNIIGVIFLLVGIVGAFFWVRNRKK